MSSISRIHAVFIALAVVIIAALAIAYFAGAFGTVAWRAIDLVRLGGQIMFLLAGVIFFGAVTGGRRAFRRPTAIYALGTVLQTPLLLNTHNLVVQVAGCAVIVMMAALAAATVVLSRRAKASARA